MKPHIKNIILTIWGSILSCLAAGQHHQYQFSRLTTSNGLSNNHVSTIINDSRGFIWFGTGAGLNRFDGLRFKSFRHLADDSTSLNDDNILDITEAADGKIWVKTRSGYNLYDPQTEKFIRNVRNYIGESSAPRMSFITNVFKGNSGNLILLDADNQIFSFDPNNKRLTCYHDKGSSASGIINEVITGISIDVNNNLWLMHYNGILERFDIKSGKVTYSLDLTANAPKSKGYYRIFGDADQDLWIYSPGAGNGIFLFKPSKRSSIHFDTQSAIAQLNSNVINSVAQDNDGLIWIATDHGGVNLFDKSNSKVAFLTNHETDNKSLAQNSVLSIYKDKLGIIWAGTFKKGISFYHKNIIKFPLLQHYPSDATSLPFSDVNRFVEDDKGNLWIGTNGGGLIYYNRNTGKYRQYMHNALDPNSLSNDVIVSLFIDHKHRLWVGSFFGGLDCFDGKKFKHYRHNETKAASISDDRVWEIFEDSSFHLWVGTLSNGLNRFDEEKGVFYHYKSDDHKSIHSNYITSILEDKKANIWIGTSQGIDCLEKKSGHFIHFAHDDKAATSLVNNEVRSLYLDSRGWLWVPTRGGLSILNPATGLFKNYHKEDGLPENNVLDILEDNRHDMWISTSNGLSNIKISNIKNGPSLTFNNYDEADGLQGLEFNESAFYKTKNGELIFGGANGFNIFYPENVSNSSRPPSLVITELEVGNVHVCPKKEINGHVILTKSISETREIKLNYDENVFSIEFTALEFFNPKKIKIRYQLEGFDKNWITADNESRKATYTNVAPGIYTFRLITVNNGVRGKQRNLRIIILPPFYKTTYAYIIYIILLIALLLGIRHRSIKKMDAKFALRHEREQAQRLHELDMMKIKFFTNVSHEFRTPLSLILAPVDNLLKQTEKTEQIKQLHLVSRNARRLLNMVNQLLDFRKMEEQELKLQLKSGDIIKFVEEVVYSFNDIAEKKDICFIYDSDCKSFLTDFDHDKLERILFNLLSNAFKFTADQGYVSVLLHLGEVSALGNEHFELEIKIVDNGVGIPIEKKESIFERFFQDDVPGFIVNQGSGIGLAITKEFVKLHNGKIIVESEVNEGSCFTVSLPLLRQSTINNANEVKAETSVAIHSLGNAISKKKHTILIIEDNDDLRFYLKDNIKEYFNVIDAINGKEGWQKALALHPNLIISDISMPEMNGIDLCKKIKNDMRTRHIPIILLTALTGEEQHLLGLETGASDYLTKPFNFDILLSKLKNILSQQDLMQSTYKKQVELNPSEVLIESPDEVFIRKALQIIEHNISNIDFSVEELSSETCMSRVTLYKKTLALTGKTPVELIRTVRLKRAAQLLSNDYLTISQVCYKVGFRSHKYFTKSFKAEFGILPSAYLNGKLEYADDFDHQ